jgi:alpha-glucosidase (family GH31 glycosyl hydrolase)
MRRPLLLVAAILVAMPALAVEAPSVRTRGSARKLTLTTQDARLQVRGKRFQLVFRAKGVVARDQDEGGLFYERAGTRVGIGAVTDVRELDAGVVLTADTDEGQPATITLRFRTSRTLEVVLEPSSPDGVTAFGTSLRSPDTEVIYGLTERLRDSPPFAPPTIEQPVEDSKPVEVGSLDRRGETVEMLVRPTFSLYAPFYQTSNGYGLLVGGTTIGVFDLAASEPETIALRFEAGTLPEHRRFTYWLFAGPEHATILDEYTALTGRPIVPPEWAFHHWRWRGELRRGDPATLDGVAMNADFVDDMSMYESLDLPAGVYVLDRPVLQGEGFGFDRFVFDEDRLPNVQAMLGALRDRGWKTMMWSSCWVCGATPGDNGYEARLLDFIAPGPGGDPICDEGGQSSFILDVTSAEARAWWRDRIAAFVAANGIQGIKLDRGEEHIASDADDIWADGRTGREARNAYPILQTELHHDALQQAFGDDFVLFTRSGYTGTQRSAIVWGGDTPGSEFFGVGPGTDLGLRMAILKQLRAAFLGYPIWGSDTGGYYQFKDREVFARWIEFSAFSGIMEIGGIGEHAPWRMPTDPAFDQEMIDIYRRYTRLRETLQPYLVRIAAEAATGMPMARPMPLVDRKDRKLRDVWDQYMLGPDLLVAPVWRIGERRRDVYLPRGRWRSYWDPSQVLKGKRVVSVDVPLGDIPVFVRDGAEVPGP